MADKWPDGWLSGAPILRDVPCGSCGRTRHNHAGIESQLGHTWIPPEDLARYDLTEMRLYSYQAREVRGNYDAPLPPPSERREIRECAELTQGELGEEISVNRQSVGQYERPPLSPGGREPVGETRWAYARYLRKLYWGEVDG